MTGDQRVYRLAYRIASFLVAVVLLTGWHKLVYPDDFAVSVYRFQLLPGVLVNITALYVPWLELTCAACLLFLPRLRVAALWITLVLLIGFTAAIGVNLWRGSAFGCGCFGRGASDMPLSWVHLVRNAGLIGLVGLALTAKRNLERGASPPPGSDRPEPSEALD